MAELQWIVKVRCVNALLAEMKVGERGEYVIVSVPNREFDPSEFDKLIEGLEVSSRIAEENRRSSKNSAHAINVPSIDEYLKKMESAGGKLVKPKCLIPDIAFFAVIKDTEGNIIGLWKDIKNSAVSSTSYKN